MLFARASDFAARIYQNTRLHVSIFWLGGSLGYSGVPLLSEVASLYLRDTRLDNRLLAKLGLATHKGIIGIELSGTRVDSNGVAYLPLVSLQFLSANNTLICDNGLKLLLKCPNLKMVSLRGSKITIDGANEFCKAAPQCELLTCQEAMKRPNRSGPFDESEGL